MLKFFLRVVTILLVTTLAFGQKDKEFVKDLDNLLKKPQVKAFLDTIAYAEGTLHKHGYYTMIGGHTFRHHAYHPGCIITVNQFDAKRVERKKKKSTAAGRYQILQKQWDRIAQILDLKDFSPKNQDKAALFLIREHGALTDVKNKKFEAAIQKLNTVWASLPPAKHNQPVVSLKELNIIYNKQLDKYRRSSGLFNKLYRKLFG